MLSFKKRIALIICIILIIQVAGTVSIRLLYNDLSSNIHTNSLLKVSTFIDDFVRVYFNCEGNKTQINFRIEDEFGNLHHNTTHLLDCNTFSEVDLQCNPQDCEYDRQYIVYAQFNNRTVNSGYFNFKKTNILINTKNRIISFFSFMIFQNSLAKGTYCDANRLIYSETGEEEYGNRYMQCHLVGLLTVLVTVFTIDIFIWVGYSIYKNVKTKKRK